MNKTPFENRIPGSMPGPSPTEKKKKLLELFRDSVREHRDCDENTSDIQNMGNRNKEVNPSINEPISKSSRSTPYISGAMCSSTERTANGDGDAVLVREKSVKSMQGCLPSLVSCRSFSERKRKMSPAISANGKH